MASGLIPGTPVGQLFSRSSQPTTPTLQDIQENILGGVSSGHAIPQLHPENSQKEAKPIWEIARQNAAYLAAICDFEPPLGAEVRFGKCVAKTLQFCVCVWKATKRQMHFSGCALPSSPRTTAP